MLRWVLDPRESIDIKITWKFGFLPGHFRSFNFNITGLTKLSPFYTAGRYDEENDDEANDAQGSNAREQSYF